MANSLVMLMQLAEVSWQAGNVEEAKPGKGRPLIVRPRFSRQCQRCQTSQQPIMASLYQYPDKPF